MQAEIYAFKIKLYRKNAIKFLIKNQFALWNFKTIFHFLRMSESTDFLSFMVIWEKLFKFYLLVLGIN